MSECPTCFVVRPFSPPIQKAKVYVGETPIECKRYTQSSNTYILVQSYLRVSEVESQDGHTGELHMTMRGDSKMLLSCTFAPDALEARFAPGQTKF